MIPHDPALDGALGRQMWEPVLTATFLDPAGKPIPALSITAPAGSYSTDATRWPRAEVTMQLPTSLTPDRTASPVSPFGGKLLLDVGVRFLGVTRMFRLATLDVVETVIDRPAGTIEVRAASHEARIDEDRYDGTATSPGGLGTTLITNVIRRTLGASHPVRNLVPPGQDVTFPAKEFTFDGGVWAVVEAIADAIGAEVYFDSSGTAVIRPTPVKGAPVLTYSTGEGGSITGYRSARGWGPNRVSAIYENEQGQRVIGLWEDTSPTSATRVTGPYGRHTEVTRVAVVKPATLPSQATANAAAANRARRLAAKYRTVELRTIPAPWIEPGDTIGVNLLGGLSETLLVARHEFPLDGLDVATITGADDQYTQDLGASGRRSPGD